MSTSTDLRKAWELFADPHRDSWASFERFMERFRLWVFCRCGAQIDSYDVRPVVEAGEDPRDYEWTCEGCEAHSEALR